MELVAIVTALALLQVFIFALQVGQQRVKHGINAPATSGNPEFERAFRVHENTVEQLIIFIPSAGIGLVFIIGRQVYRSSYIGDPASRSAGFGIGAAAMMILLLGGLVGAVMALL